MFLCHWGREIDSSAMVFERSCDKVSQIWYMKLMFADIIDINQACECFRGSQLW